MDVATIASIVFSTFSIILTFISIICLIATLRQNNKMIENATRPYVCVYFDYMQNGEPIGYFVVKNFGTSSAIIDSLTYNDFVKNQPKSLADISTILDGLSGNSIAPGQKFIAPFKLYECKDDIATFDIHYHTEKNKYSEHFEIIVSNYGKLVKPRITGTNKDYDSISYPLQEISERLM